MRVRVADRGVVLLMTAKATSRSEGRPRPERSPGETQQDRAQNRNSLPGRLAWVKEAAERSRQTRFTTLLHHIDEEALARAFARLKRRAAPGVDGMTVADYEQGLAERLRELCERVQSGRYRPLPVRRTYIPKADGGQRPLGVPALEDKIVQGAVAEMLSAIYEADFLDCSYGFRPGRSAHQALRAVHDAIMTERVNWVLEADIRKFFDSVDHQWLSRMLAQRIADPRILRLISLWLRAGILEEAVFSDTVEGTPQGAGISPLLANIFLHYALDLWVAQWSRQRATGRMRLVRYADDFIVTFERRAEAQAMAAALADRLAKFGLRLHEGKTRLIEFGRFAEADRRQRGETRPATFDFLGFTHYCGKTRDGRFIAKCRTQRQRKIRKLKELRQEMRRRMHRPLGEQQQWLSSVLRGHYAYYGITGNYRSLAVFFGQVLEGWIRALRRRGQRPHMPWERFHRILEAFPLPEPRIVHDWRACTA